MTRRAYRSLAVLLLAGLGLLLASATDAQVDSPQKFRTKDLGLVNVGCEPERFIVSVDRDDDDNNDREDRRHPPTVHEDNLREFIFSAPNAAEVYVAEPIDTLTNTSAVGTYVAGFRDDRTTPFTFDRLYPIPATLLLRGLRKSPEKEHIRFEVQFRDAEGVYLPCGQGVSGHVVDVVASLSVPKGPGARFRRANKMLITGQGTVSATVDPSVPEHRWRYSGFSTVDYGDPAALNTTLTAGIRPTGPPFLDSEEAELLTREFNLAIIAHWPVNLTAPTHLEAYGRNRRGFRYRTGFINANRGRAAILPTRRVRYRMLDQWQQRIKRNSAYGGATPQIRENIGNVLTSPVPALNNWIATGLSWSPNWVDKPNARFTDRIEITGVDKDLMVVVQQGRRSFHPQLRAVGGVFMQIPAPQSHVWDLSVNGQNVVGATQNTFSSTVTATRQRGGGTQIQLTTVYGVVTP